MKYIMISTLLLSLASCATNKESERDSNDTDRSPVVPIGMTLD